MEHYRRTAHTRFDIKFHLVWITKYRKKLLRADVAIRLRQLVRDICSELEVEILKGHVSKDHVHLFVSCPPHVSASYLMQRIKGKSSRKLLQQFRVRPVKPIFKLVDGRGIMFGAPSRCIRWRLVRAIAPRSSGAGTRGANRKAQSRSAPRGVADRDACQRSGSNSSIPPATDAC